MTLVLNGTTGISAVDGSAATPAIQGNDTNTGVFFPAADTVAIATNGTERVRADSSGNVGIGTSSPAEKFVVSNGGANGVELVPTISSGTESRIQSYNRSGAAYTPLSFDGQIQKFLTGGSERARIDSSGNLLVGTPSSSYSSRLEVSHPGADGITTIFNGTSGNNAMKFRNGNGQVGSIITSGSSTSFNTSSDYRLKHDIAPMTGALEKVQALKPVTYKWNADNSAGEGFIAHELQEVCPDAVSGEKDAVNEDGSIKPQGIDTSFLVATLTAAIQEQQTMIVALKAEVDALKGAQP